MQRSIARPAFVATRRVSVSWPAIYCSVAFALWVTSPFLRRLVDWKSTFAAISPIAALPLLILVPATIMAFISRSRKVDRSFELAALLWTGGLVYALIVGCFDGRILGAIYAFAQFFLPLGFGYWIATQADDSDLWYKRVSTTMIVLAVIAGVYGIIQYVILPPWDKQWMLSVPMASNGFPVPFRFRVFSTLNAPATFGIYGALATVMFLPRLTLKNAALLTPVFAGLALSSIRASWVTTIVGVIVFASLTTRRKIVLQGVFGFIGIGMLAIVASSAFTTDSTDVVSRVTDRFSTLGDIANDASAADRARQMSEAFSASLQDPEGLGMGAIGVATRLSSSGEDASMIDSGYLARFLEMGVPGIAAFLGSLGFALFAAIQAWRRAVDAKNEQRQNMSALAITMVIVMLMLNVFGDAGSGLPAMAMWTTLALLFREPAVASTRR